LYRAPSLRRHTKSTEPGRILPSAWRQERCGKGEQVGLKRPAFGGCARGRFTICYSSSRFLVPGAT
jgi:hypothetical protein